MMKNCSTFILLSIISSIVNIENSWAKFAIQPSTIVNKPISVNGAQLGGPIVINERFKVGQTGSEKSKTLTSLNQSNDLPERYGLASIQEPLPYTLNQNVGANCWTEFFIFKNEKESPVKDVPLIKVSPQTEFVVESTNPLRFKTRNPNGNQGSMILKCLTWDNKSIDRNVEGVIYRGYLKKVLGLEGVTDHLPAQEINYKMPTAPAPANRGVDQL